MRKLALIMLFAIILCKSVYADDLLHYFDTSGIEASVEKNSNINFSELFNNIISGNASEVKNSIIDNRCLRNSLFYRTNFNIIYSYCRF